MGTRHLITIIKDGEFKLAQYGQWDGYPSGQGADILKFLAEGDIEALKRNVDKLYCATNEEVDALFQTIGIEPGKEWISMDENGKLKETFPTLHRDTGAKIFEMLASGQANRVQDLAEGDDRIPTINSIDFAGGWGCEWVYAVDLDSGTFEVYEAGLGNEAEHNRFTDVIKKEYEGNEDGPCFVHLIGEYKFDALPSWEQFLEELEPEALERHREWLAAQKAAEEQAETDEADEDKSADTENGDDGDKPIWSV